MSMQTDSGATHPMLSYTDKLATQWTDFLLLAGRVILGWIFVMYGWTKLFGIPEYAATFPRRGLSTWMAYIAVPAEFFVGLALILGFATRYAVLIMLFYMVVASFSSHTYWNVPEAQRVNQMAHFWKNISMMGGMVLLFITGAGRFSLDWMLAKKR
jgi:putative oxidoreductase